MSSFKAMPRTARKLRTPQHPFNIRTIPFVIQPFFIAPVLPGETMKNLLLQVRAVSDPINSPLVGWWNEYHFFYVKLRDLYSRDEFTKMFTDIAWDPDTVVINVDQGYTSNKLHRYFAGGANQIDYTELCLRRVVDCYMRDEGEDYTVHTINDGTYVVPVAQLSGNSVFDSIINEADWSAVDVNVDGPDANTTIQASEVELAMQQYALLQQQNLLTMNFDDYLKMCGITVKPEEAHRPELIRSVRDWQYPSNTIDPSNGTPRSAVSWSMTERADKDRFFKEPGFLFGINIVRPKVHRRYQFGTFTSDLNSIKAWLHPLLAGNPTARRKNIPNSSGPLLNNSDANGYRWDVADLFIHGEQFRNYSDSLAVSLANALPLPAAGAPAGRYPAAFADIQALFVTGASCFVRQDGLVSLNIASALTDMSPRGGPVADA